MLTAFLNRFNDIFSIITNYNYECIYVFRDLDLDLLKHEVHVLNISFILKVNQGALKSHWRSSDPWLKFSDNKPIY